MDLRNYIDHTLLKPEAGTNDIEALCRQATERNFKAVCIPPRFVAFAKRLLESTETAVCTVIGFPLGYNTSAVKAQETEEAVANGADEIDMVIAVGALKEGDTDYVLADIRAVRAACEGKVLKVILETSLLTDEEIVTACELAIKAGADFVKTSTGFSTGGATEPHVRLMKQAVGKRAQVKASGGIRDTETALKMVEAGATRLGTSSGMQLTEEN